MVRSRKSSSVQKADMRSTSDSPYPTIPAVVSAEDDERLAQQGLLEEDEENENEPGSSSGSRTHKKTTEPPPCPTEVFVISCLLVLGILLLFFLCAPWFGSILRPPPLPTTATIERPPTFIKPVGPPGSITDKTEKWAAQGGSWKNVDLEAEYKAAESAAPLFNGTHKFKKTVILVSLDGFRADYLDRKLTPSLLSISEKGLRAKSMKPEFPTLTFPNHWSMMTGLHPESHGIVGNEFRDPEMHKTFTNVDPHQSWDPSWWLGEPIWATAVKQQIRTAISMWPGPPYTRDKTRPTYWRAYEDRFKWWKKIRQLENWLDLPVKDRPQLIAMYMPEVDQMGHHYGPDNAQLNKTLVNMDQFASAMHEVLKMRNLLQIIDVIYVSDHGMMATSDSRVVYLDKVLGKDYFDQIEFTDGWPSAGLRFPAGVDTKPILAKLLEATKTQPGFDVYTHETMPPRWHFTNSPRIAPIYLVPRPGWVISNTHEHQVTMNGTYNVKGVHGYDNDEPSMQAIFIAHGPFAEKIKSQQLQTTSLTTASPLAKKRASVNTSNFIQPSSSKENGNENDKEVKIGTIESFSNLEIHSLIAKLLDIKDLPSNNCTKGFWDQYF